MGAVMIPISRWENWYIGEVMAQSPGPHSALASPVSTTGTAFVIRKWVALWVWLRPCSLALLGHFGAQLYLLWLTNPNQRLKKNCLHLKIWIFHPNWDLADARWLAARPGDRLLPLCDLGPGLFFSGTTNFDSCGSLWSWASMCWEQGGQGNGMGQPLYSMSFYGGKAHFIMNIH